MNTAHTGLTTGWTLYIIALVAVNIGGCVWLMWWTSRRRPGDPAPEDTLHTWDNNLREYNKPLPRWWIILFYLTIFFGLGYFIYYGIAGIQGYGHWTSKGEEAAEQAVEQAKMNAAFKPYDGQSIDQLAKDPKALALGKSIFANNCTACHGSLGKGAVGFPNLTDTVWKWGGDPDTILTTVLDGRIGIMAPWGEVLTNDPDHGGADAVDDVVTYVQSLSSPGSLQNDPIAAKGKALFDLDCVACHGEDGKGNQMLGAPDLTDSDWLYGKSKMVLHKTIAEGRTGTMPAWRDVLGETRVRLAAAYVWSLSHPDAAGNKSAE